MGKLLVVADIEDTCYATPRGLQLAAQLGYAVEVVAFAVQSHLLAVVGPPGGTADIFATDLGPASPGLVVDRHDFLAAVHQGGLDFLGPGLFP